VYHFEQVSGPPLFADSDRDLSYGVPKWLLTAADPALAVRFNDLQHLEAKTFEGSERMTFASIHFVRREGGAADGGSPRIVVGLELKKTAKSAQTGRYEPLDLWNDGPVFCLYERATEGNIQKLLKHLRSQTSPAFTDLLEDPYRWSDRFEAPEARRLSGELCGRVEEALRSINATYTELRRLDRVDRVLAPQRDRQLEAFQRLLWNRLTLVWGPPGEWEPDPFCACLGRRFA
jgi:hypothetical protein